MGLNIRRAIKEHGLKNKEVAERMGISVVGLQQHLKNKPTVKVLENIAAAIGCDVVELFDPVGNKPVVTTKFTCPHCGKVYNITIAEQTE